MADQDTAGEVESKPGESGPTPAADQKQGGTAPKTPNEGEGGNKPQGEDAGTDGAINPDKFHVPVRKGPEFFHAQRQKGRFDKFEERFQRLESVIDQLVKGGDGEGEETDAVLTKEELAAIDRKLKPYVDSFQEHVVNTEVADYLGKRPEHRKYEGLARKYMGTKGYEKVPAEIIFKALAYDEAFKIGAERANAANIEAKENQLGGNSARRTAGTGKNIWDYKNEDFETMVEGVKSGALNLKKDILGVE